MSKTEKNKCMENSLCSLFQNSEKLKVPAYQRAYSWEEKQLEQFISDMLEMKETGNYYYGHFILEKSNDSYEIIDGQQRITTFILFLMVCNLLNEEPSKTKFENIIDKFETVDYDSDVFKEIQSKIKETNQEWSLENLEIEKNQTLSIKRIMYALNYFYKLFKNSNSSIKLHSGQIDKYVETFLEAQISIHTTCDKSVAVQIFELHNTRGIQLSLIEKVKSKLMKAVYLNSEHERREGIINEVQKHFAEIYRMEELVASNSFRGDLTLDEILLLHLRIVDDGKKLDINDVNILHSPSLFGNRDENILNYLQNHLTQKENDKIVDYIQNLVIAFETTVSLICEKLPKLDEKNQLIGDVLILDRTRSLEFFIILFHKFKNEFVLSEDLIRDWERLLFTRDFHDVYYRQKLRDNFEGLYLEVLQKGNPKNVIEEFIKIGFRSDLMGNDGLQDTVRTYIKNNISSILNNAFDWHIEKMVYTLYKYEINQGADLGKLRNIMKKGRSVEHILPQSWEWGWIGENDPNNISDNGKKLSENIAKTINGIGNLILVTPSENSKLSNNHPKVKSYLSCSGGSYDIHNSNKSDWEDYNCWNTKIKDRGNEIYKFLIDLIN